MEPSASPEEDQRLAALRAELAATQLRSANLEATLHELTHHQQDPAAEPMPTVQSTLMETAVDSASFGASSNREAGADAAGRHFGGDESSLEADPLPGGNFLTTITEVREK